MSKPSSGAIKGLLKLHYNHLRQLNLSNSKPSIGFSNPTIFFTSQIHSKPSSSNFGLSEFLFSPYRNPLTSLLRISRRNHCCSFSRICPPASPTTTTQTFSCRILLGSVKPSGSSSEVRYFSVKTPNLGKINRNFSKTIFEKPATVITSAFSRYRGAIGLQVDAFWKRNYLFLLGVGGVVTCALLWRIMFGIANTFIGFSEGMAKYGFLALSSAMVVFAGLYIRSRLTINPDKVYRMAMRKLNTSAGILEVMGAPLAGTDLRAYVMSGGGLTLKNFKPVFRSKRCFLIFPIRGSDRKGLVSVEVKKKKGQYDLKLLAIDIPMTSGPDQRLFLIGDEDEYKIGGGLISELRDPVVKAMAATKEFDDIDQIEEEEDAERELQEAERKHREEIEKLEKGGQQ